jgi:uncharacterized damage-inducible protein DinB
MNPEIDRFVRELQHAHAGDPWHGPSRAHVLADITVEEAARHPGGTAHGIWELVLHMHAWTREVTRRLSGAAPRMPAEGDWPPVPEPTGETWDAALRSLDVAHAEITTALRTFDPARLDEPVGTDRDAPLGAGVTYRAMLHGLAQHDAYHTGQISILVRMYRGKLGKLGSDS